MLCSVGDGPHLVDDRYSTVTPTIIYIVITPIRTHTAVVLGQARAGEVVRVNLNRLVSRFILDASIGVVPDQ
jgi:hypothetical protein